MGHLPVLRNMGRLEICCVNHAGNASGRLVANAETASSRDLRENEAGVDSAFNGSSE